MRVHLAEAQLHVEPGLPSIVPIEIFNDDVVIAGYDVRVLGLDPSWSTLEPSHVSLFPDSATTLYLTIALPPDLPSGIRVVTIEVTERNDPTRVTLQELSLVVQAERTGRIQVEPVSATAGSEARFSLAMANTGNTDVDVEFEWEDEEDALWMEFEPPVLRLGAGQQTTIGLTATGKRPWFGSPAPRPFTIRATGFERPTVTTGVFVQKPRISRGALALAGLLLGIAVFAGVLTATLARIVDSNRADAELAVDVLEAGERAALAQAPGQVSGAVTGQADGAAVAGATVDAFAADDTSSPVASSATDDQGSYTVAGVPVGDYLIRFRAAGFADHWYGGTLTAEGATPVTVASSDGAQAIDAVLRGADGSIAGTVVGDEPAGSTIDVGVILGPDGTATLDTVIAVDEDDPAPAAGLLRTVTVDEDGTFEIGSLPSPLAYTLTLRRDGYADSVRILQLAAGEDRTGVQLALRRGDGEIRGEVVSDAGSPIGGAVVAVGDGTTTFTTRSLTTTGEVGDFAMRNLPTDTVYTVTVSAPGYLDATVAVTVGNGAEIAVDGVRVALTRDRSSIVGTVRSASGPLGGVTVTATNGTDTATTLSQSTGAPGTFLIPDVEAPATYSLTFAKSGFQPATRSVSVTPGGAGEPIDVTLRASTGTLSGLVEEIPVDEDPNDGVTPAQQPVGDVTITLTSGDRTYQTTSASAAPSGAAGSVGRYRLTGIEPGTYSVGFSQTGRQSFVALVTIAPEASVVQNALLQPQASIFGIVRDQDSALLSGVVVRLYRTSQFPGTVLRTQNTTAAGRYDFRGLEAPEDYIVTFAYPFGQAEAYSREVNGLVPGQRFDAGTQIFEVD